MKTILCALFSAFAAAGLCTALGFFPYLFNPVSSEFFNQKLSTTHFAGNVLQGTMIAILMIAYWHGSRPSSTNGRIACYIVLLLAVGLIIPFGSLYSGDYSDGLFSWYVVLSALVGAFTSRRFCIPCMLSKSRRLLFEEHHCGRTQPP